MTADLMSLLYTLLPKAIAWAEREETRAFAIGAALSPEAQSLARRVGVLHVERIRIVVSEALPFPDDPQLQEVAHQAALLGANTLGLTLGHAVFIRRGYEDNTQLLSHELRHVYQYESLGSIARFLPVYLQQIVQVGYENAPLEVDARAHEVR